MEEKNKVVDIINNLPLEEDIKTQWLARLEIEGPTHEFIDELLLTIQSDIDKTFDEQDIALDENDPEYKQAYENMQAELQKIEAEYKKGMDQLDEESKEIQKQAVQELDAIDEEEAKQAIQNA